MSGILIDTCIWSHALRSISAEKSLTSEKLIRIIDNNQAKIIGAIRQELLSGYSNKKSYEILRQKLAYFPNQAIVDDDYEAAAEYSNLCRSKGIQGSHTDFLICAVSVRNNFQIFTDDNDFLHYSKHLSIKLL